MSPAELKIYIEQLEEEIAIKDDVIHLFHSMLPKEKPVFYYSVEMYRPKEVSTKTWH